MIDVELSIECHLIPTWQRELVKSGPSHFPDFLNTRCQAKFTSTPRSKAGAFLRLARLELFMAAKDMGDALMFKRLSYEIRCRLNEFTGAEFKVWMCLLSHANSKRGNRAWCGIKLIARETGLSKHGVDDAIAGLKEKGWIVRQQVHSCATGQRTSASTWCYWAPTVKNSMWDRVSRASKSDTR